jgi:oxygen-independent coproporphyrinogen-3 oxidase
VAAGGLSSTPKYLQALMREAWPLKGRDVSSVYVGGGTPSCLSVDEISSLMQMVHAGFNVLDGAEISFEANPESIDEHKARALVRGKVNRVSLGAQSFDDALLARLGRGHGAADTFRAFQVLRSAGCTNINLDLIFGFPGQTQDELVRDLEALVSVGPEHVSVYALNIEPRSLFAARRIKADENVQAGMYAVVCERLEAAGFMQYEVSNFARPGHASRHNINTWRGGEYFGLGMAAHRHINGKRSWNADTLPAYLKAIEESGQACAGEEAISPPEKMTETFLFGLRMNEGVDLEALEASTGIKWPEVKREALEQFIEMGLLQERDARICTTSRGRLVLDEICARLV